LPARLSDLPEPPQALYVRGDFPRDPAVAIVGTRAPTAEGEAFAQRLAAELAGAGVAILSGGAKGIDTAAHRGALSAKGKTVVVAPAGFLRAYPEENAPLFEQVVRERGCYLAHVPDDEPATRAAFFARNGYLVALAHVVVVVQAGLRSGARNAAAQARRLGRPLLVVPSSPWIARGRGCLAELRQGARPCERAEDVIAALLELGCNPIALPPKRRRASRAARALPMAASERRPPVAGDLPLHWNDLPAPERLRILLSKGVNDVDDLSAQAGLSVSETQRVLLTLRLRGVLACDPTGRLLLRNCLD
jgi:DNA processing protein